MDDVRLCTRVVLDLMSGLEGSGLDLYTDNYYTSPTLFLYLFNQGINVCGMVRTWFSKGPCNESI